MQPLYRLDNLHFSHGRSFALQIDKLLLARGGFYSLVGPNGSGKSTLLRILALLLTPQQGELVFNGARVNGNPEQLRRLRQQVTLVEQSPYLFSGSVYNNLVYGLQLRRLPQVEQGQRIAEALQQVGLAGFEQRSSRQLSEGQLQRVALARALALKPLALLLDEPTSNSDREHRQVFEQLLLNLRQQGTTVVFASHDLKQAQRLDAEVLSLDSGRLLETSGLSC